MPKHFYTVQNWTTDELKHLLSLAHQIKNGQLNPDLKGQTLVMLFYNPSLRTRLSFEIGMHKMKGHAAILQPGKDTWQFEFKKGVKMDGSKQEHIQEAVQVIASYANAIAIRNSELITTQTAHENVYSWDELKQDAVLKAFMEYSRVPVINLESNLYHPCQALGDALTLQEQLGDHGSQGKSFNQNDSNEPNISFAQTDLSGKKYVLTWAPHPKPLPLATPHSQLLLPAKLGLDVTLCHPPGFELDPEIIAAARNYATENKSHFEITHSQEEAFQNADVICAKSWASLKHFGQWEKETEYRAQFSDWIINEEKMALTKQAKFMHCLPVRRNVVVSDAVLDGPDSIVIPQAENRLWAQMALLYYLLT